MFAWRNFSIFSQATFCLALKVLKSLQEAAGRVFGSLAKRILKSVHSELRSNSKMRSIENDNYNYLWHMYKSKVKTRGKYFKYKVMIHNF